MSNVSPIDPICVPANGGRRCATHYGMPLYADGFCAMGRDETTPVSYGGVVAVEPDPFPSTKRGE